MLGAMLRTALAAILIVGCGGRVDAPSLPDVEPTPSPPTEVVTASGSVVGSVEVRLGTSVSDVRIEPLAASVLLYPLQVMKEDRAGAIPSGQPVAQTESGADGRYSITAAAGNYTIVVLWNGKYSPRTSSADGWNAVRIDAHGSTELLLVVNENKDY
jgi:hypothetical protein